MPTNDSRPLLNTVLRFTKEPRPQGVTGGGKNAAAIQTHRLLAQRRKLNGEFRELAATAANQPQFNRKVVVYAAMFDDSMAASYTPRDLFQSKRGARLIAPFNSGYLVEIDVKNLRDIASAALNSDLVADKVDISRTKSVRFFGEQDATGLMDLDQAWSIAPKQDGGKPFLTWFMPFADAEAAEELLDRLESLRDGIIAPAPPLLAGMIPQTDDVPASLQRSVRNLSRQDRLNVALRNYRQSRRAITTLLVPSRVALGQLAASGAVFRLEPVTPICSTAPGGGTEPNRPLPAAMATKPVVGVVDGGLTATSYQPAEAWRAPEFVSDLNADAAHGNRVTSLIVQGHDWNNNLSLPPLYCRVGVVQAVPKKSSGAVLDPQALLAYLNLIMGAYSDAKVWNMSFNQLQPCDPNMVSFLGHGLSIIARKHRVLLMISVGNKPGDLLQPPADCEAAITVGGRLHDEDGKPSGACSVSLGGPGPANMLKPEASNFSKVRVLGGLLTTGSSFATALTSPVAAHTAQRLRVPSPDLVKALLLHRCDGNHMMWLSVLALREKFCLGSARSPP